MSLSVSATLDVEAAMDTLGMVQEAKIVVGLDFGTTFSGFAYALRSDPDTIYTFYDWPLHAEAGALPYCKTQTSLLYYSDNASHTSADPLTLHDWGWPAFVKSKSTRAESVALQQPHPSSSATERHFLTLFKLHLATKSDSSSAQADLPPGMTARRAIADYLSQLSKFILQEVRNKFGKLRNKWSKGDKFHCRGGTVDLVLHEKLGAPPTLTVQEVQESSGALCGGSRVDDKFFWFLRQRISCFQRFTEEHPGIFLAFRQDWERIKYDFGGGNGGPVHVELPPTLATMWEEDPASPTRQTSLQCYDEIELTDDAMKSIFDPVVDKILQLVEVRMVSDLKAIVVVGGFSASPYLMRRMKETFGGRGAAIVSPPCPGSAVCCGAVTMGIRSETVVSRISTRTYGQAAWVRFVPRVHPRNLKEEGDPGEFWCGHTFETFVNRGDEIRNNDCVRKSFKPISKSQKFLPVKIYSSACPNPRYCTDPGVRSEGTFSVPCPSYRDLGLWPWVKTCMYFGRTEIQVTAVAENFPRNFHSGHKEMLPVKFERDSLY